jgi:GNAT superfamily N-acetyltransferase
MIGTVTFDARQHVDILGQLLTEYLDDDAHHLREAGIEENVPAIVQEDLATLHKFTPPLGQLILATNDGAVVGCGAIRIIIPGVAEIKRMYLRPELRGKGLGRLLIERLMDEARSLGCREARLDTGWFMTDAQRLYRAAGFTECEPYQESEIPADFDPRWKYMRRDL